MSVESVYYTLPWDRVASLSEEDEPAAALFDAIEQEAPWLGDFTFGPQIDSTYFSSWHALAEVSDWLETAASHLIGDGVAVWREVFEDLGLIYRGDTSAFRPVCEVLTADDWLLGSIPPDRIRVLHELIEALDLQELETAFDRALAEAPFELLPTGGEWADWVRSLRVALEHAAEQEVGVLIGAA